MTPKGPVPAHFYHIWADGEWEAPVNEHFELLRKSEFTGNVFAGVVGSPDARKRVKQKIRGTEIIAEAESGYEYVTMRAMHSWVSTAASDTAVMYSHTKGAYAPSEYNSRWRFSMDINLLSRWQQHVSNLIYADAIGCHWLEPGRDYGLGDFRYEITTPFFGGNFWWATAGYLSSLPEINTESRYDAESWIGLGNPKIIDLIPGWPVY